MNSREIVQRTLDFTGPERVARSFGERHCDALEGLESDFAHGRTQTDTYATLWQEVGGGRWERYDEWGNLWGRIDATSKGEVVKGVIAEWDALDTYTFPDYSRPADYDAVREERQVSPDKWLIGSLPGFTFNIARKMRKLDQYLMDLLLEPERIRELHDRIDAVLEDMIRNYAAAGADCVMFPEDWGTQTQTLISPKLWHREFYPRFERLCKVAHDNGLRVFMHSCGQITAIVPGLIAAGIDLLQFDQPDLHGIDTLAKHQESAPITFWTPVDIQKTLQTRDRDIITAKAREMLDKLWHGRGGFVAGYYGDNASIGLDPQWQAYACETFLEQGKREHYVPAGVVK